MGESEWGSQSEGVRVGESERGSQSEGVRVKESEQCYTMNLVNALCFDIAHLCCGVVWCGVVCCCPSCQ